MKPSPTAAALRLAATLDPPMKTGTGAEAGSLDVVRGGSRVEVPGAAQLGDALVHEASPAPELDAGAVVLARVDADAEPEDEASS